MRVPPGLYSYNLKLTALTGQILRTIHHCDWPSQELFSIYHSQLLLEVLAGHELRL